MSDPLPPVPRRYGEREITRILERAAELQVAEPSVPNPAGMTLDELEEIAVEAGIDPRYLRRAASELDVGGDSSLWEEVVGDALTVVFEHTVPGELSEGGFERVLAAIQMAAHDHGQPSLLGRTLTWQSETPTKSRSLMVVVSARDGETRIRVEERLHQLAGQLFGGLMAGGGLGVGLGVGLPIGIEVLGSALFAVAAPLGIVGVAAVLAREVYRRNVRNRRRVLGDLADRIVAEVTASIVEGVAGPEAREALPSGDAGPAESP